MSFGAVQSAISSMKNNRKLLSKRKDKKSGFVYASIEKTEYDLPKITPEKLGRIRERMTQENKNRGAKRLIILSVFVSILLSLFTYFF